MPICPLNPARQITDGSPTTCQAWVDGKVGTIEERFSAFKEFPKPTIPVESSKGNFAAGGRPVNDIQIDVSNEYIPVNDTDVPNEDNHLKDAGHRPVALNEQSPPNVTSCPLSVPQKKSVKKSCGIKVVENRHGSKINKIPVRIKAR